MSVEFLFRKLLEDHSKVAWDESARNALKCLPLHFVAPSDASDINSGLIIPLSIPFSERLSIAPVSFFDIDMPIVSPLEPDDFPDFQPLTDFPWLWKNKSNAVMFAFNFGAIIDLLFNFKETLNPANFDKHERLEPTSCALGRLGLLGTPLVNVYLLAVLSVAKGAAAGQFVRNPRSHVLPPAVVLSHDCDQLRGNDFYTQAVRLVRAVLPVLRLAAPDLRQFRHFFTNALFPRKYYFDDALKMLSLEIEHGFRSSFYFLNGGGGRFGARSGDQIIRQFALALAGRGDMGIHYNYRYSRRVEMLAPQVDSLEGLIGVRPRSGRAHYLAFNPLTDFRVLTKSGIEVDESVGFATECGFRLGFGGAFRTWYGIDDGDRPVVEIPLQFMDSNIVDAAARIKIWGMLSTIQQVGGVVSLLFHPGAYESPETAQLNGVYRALLVHFSKNKFRSFTAAQIGTLLLESTAGSAKQ